MKTEDLNLSEVCGGGGVLATCGTLALGAVSVGGVALVHDGVKRACEKGATIEMRALGVLEAMSGNYIAFNGIQATCAAVVADVCPEMILKK